MRTNPYDELPYRSRPVEWTAPERLAVTSLLHGGPRPSLDRYRVLELGCGNGANLLPMAWYRRHASFVGIDGAASQVRHANSVKTDLHMGNVEFIRSDLVDASRELDGQFDFILAHGVFSWVDDEARKALLTLCSQRLAANGLVYLNYNALPGWNVRGMVRDFLLAQTRDALGLRARAQMAQEVSSILSVVPPEEASPYSRLLADEFRFVCGSDVSYIAHEYLAQENRPFWHSEFQGLAARYGLGVIADADFNYTTGRIPENLVSRLVEWRVTGRSLEDTADLLCYRQLRSPILARTPIAWRSPGPDEFANLLIASSLAPDAAGDDGTPSFVHPSGYEVDVRAPGIQAALEKLRTCWPRGLRIGKVFENAQAFADDLRLLHRTALIELRCVEPAEFGVDGSALNAHERRWGRYSTTAYHVCDEDATDPQSKSPAASNERRDGGQAFDGSPAVPLNPAEAW